MKINLKNYFFSSLLALFLGGGLLVMDSTGILESSKIVFFCLVIFAGIISFTRPRLGFWLFTFFLVFEKNIISSDNFPISIRPFQLFGGFMLISLFWGWIKGRQEFSLMSFREICIVCKIKNKFCKIKKTNKVQVKSFNWLDRLIFIFPVFAVVGAYTGPTQEASLKMALILATFVGLFWLSRNLTQTIREKSEAFWFFFLGSFPVLFFGFYQAVAFRLNWLSFQVFTGRVNGTFTEPDWLGMYLTVVLAMLLWLRFILINAKREIMIGNFQAKKIGLILVDIYFFFVFWLLYLTVARSAWLGFMTVLFFYLLIVLIKSPVARFARFLREGFFLAIVIILVILVTNWSQLSTFHFADRASSSISGLQLITISCEREVDLPDQIQSINQLEQFNCRHIDLEEIEAERRDNRMIDEIYRPDPNINIRKAIYGDIWQKIKEQPWTGYGLASSSFFLGTDNHGNGFNSSNLLLEIWFSMGIGGLLIAIIVFGYLFFVAIRVILTVSIDEGSFKLAFFTLLSLVAVAIPNFFNSGLMLAFFWFYLASIMDLIDYQKRRP